MSPSRILALVLLAVAAAAATPAFAADPCPVLRAGTDAGEPPDHARRIAIAACEEHRLWYRTFIGLDGRIAGSKVREAEASPLANGQSAWRRVVDYWRGGGLADMAGACNGGDAACRAFVVDTPWSAAFVSWVMRRAGVPGFRSSPSHVRYVRHARRAPHESAWRFLDPAVAAPGQGDMLCYVRVPQRSFGHDGLDARLAASDAGLDMHCDIVVGTNPSVGDAPGTAYLIGGNVLDGVTMRLLPLAGDGRFASLPRRPPAGDQCSPDLQTACDANGQDWAVLLQLRPSEDLVAMVHGGGVRDTGARLATAAAPR